MRRFAIFLSVCAVVLSAFALVSAAQADTFIGNNYRQVWNGTWGADYFEARGAGDEVWAKGGNDDILMGTGNDRAYGGADDDYIVGGDGIDWLYAGCDGSCDAGNNYIFGGDGTDYLAANNNRYDELNCGAGYDHVWYDVGLDDVSNCEDYGGFAAFR